MNDTHVNRIVQAVLYEGYLLYPYRPSTKSRQRWTFGGLYPPAYIETNPGADNSLMQTQCLFVGTHVTDIAVKVRFLHLLARNVEKADPHAPQGFTPVASLEVNGKQHDPWQEAVERTVCVESMPLPMLLDHTHEARFECPGGQWEQPLLDHAGRLAGRIHRQQQPLEGVVEVSANYLTDNLYQLTVWIENRTALDRPEDVSRDDALMRSMVSTHTILSVKGGEFLSLADPPELWREYAAECNNAGTWPVLVGPEGRTDMMLSSPVTLYDYPQIAPENPSDLFDGLEIDELLELRIASLTDQEKRQMSAVDDRVAAVLQRTESLANAQLMNLHGNLRDVHIPPGEVQP